MKKIAPLFRSAACLMAVAAAAVSFSPTAGLSQDSAASVHEGSWISWRGPLQTGVSLEKYSDGAKFNPKPEWEKEIAGRGTPIIFKGKVYSWGYRGKGPDLEEVLTCYDEKTGDSIWEAAYHDFISDTIYNRYSIGSVAVDAETENIYMATTYGLVVCFDNSGKELWQISMIERFGRLTFPNGRAGSPVVDGNLMIIRGVTSYWGADGPARDRFFAFDKNTGDLVWSSAPGTGPPYLKDSSMSTPFLETRGGRRVFYAGTGCGNIVCVNVADGTPLWRLQISKGGINSSPVLDAARQRLICVHGAENIDTTETGRAFALHLPEDYGNTGGEVEADQGGAPQLSADIEDWRAPLDQFTSSPLVHDGRVYQLVKTGSLFCMDAESGKILWDLKLSNEQLHASPAMADGILYIPMYEGKLFVVKPGDTSAEILHEINLVGNAIGSPAICNGKVYVHTTEKLYRFGIDTDSIAWNDAPDDAWPKAGEATSISVVPSDVLLNAGDSTGFALRTVDANGLPVGTVESGEWEKFVPPTAKVKAEMDASVIDGKLTASADANESAGMFKVSADGLTGFVRGRVIPNPPISLDFEGDELTGESTTNGAAFAYPPLPWIGGRFKWEVQEHEGNKVLMKTLDRILFMRCTTFIGDPELSNYTMQADVMTDGNRRVKSVVGLVNQRYIISLVGNSNVIEVSSNHERVKEEAPFSIAANTWYTLKTRVDIGEDGSGVIRGKAWPKGEAEPDAWTIEVEHKNAHKKGAPGLFGFSPQSQKAVFVDNITITPNE